MKPLWNDNVQNIKFKSTKMLTRDVHLSDYTIIPNKKQDSMKCTSLTVCQCQKSSKPVRLVAKIITLIEKYQLPK